MGKTYQSVVVNAPVDTVWKKIRNFHDLSWSKNVVQKVDVVGDAKGDQIGAKRVLNDAFHETLLELDDIDRAFRYSIDNGPGPLPDVTNYIGHVRMFGVTQGAHENQTFVEWTSSWEGKDAECAEFCHPIYVALLDDLHASFAG